MPFMSLPKAVESNRRTRPRIPALISVDKFTDKSDRTLTFGVTGSVSDERIEYMHVYMRDEAIHVLRYFLGADERWFCSKKFQTSQVEAKTLRPPSGSAWSASDEEFAKLMETAGYPMYFIPLEVWGKPITRMHGDYFGHVSGVTCKLHTESLDF